MKNYLKSLAPLLTIAIISIIIVSCNSNTEKSYFREISVEIDNTSFPDYDPLVLKPGPAHGDTVGTNPPGFHWPQEEGSEGFILEISRDIHFDECNSLFEKAIKKGRLIPLSLSETPIIYKGETSWLIAGLPLPLHRPSFVIGTGDWYWRWRSVMQGNDVQQPSAVRKFTISTIFNEHKVPPLKDLYSNIPDAHPRLFIRPEQIDSLRGLLQTSTPHRDLYSRIAD